MKNNPEIGFEIIRITEADFPSAEGQPLTQEDIDELDRQCEQWVTVGEPSLRRFQTTKLYHTLDGVFEKFYRKHDLIETTARYILIRFFTRMIRDAALFKESDESNFY